MHVVGNLLVSVAVDGRVVAWQLPDSPKDHPSKDGHVWTDMLLAPEHKVTCMTHPHTYRNKVLLGTQSGKCILLNLKTRKVVHIFDVFQSPIQVLAASPVIDVVAVGMANGQVTLHNFRVDETIVTFTQESDNASALNREAAHVASVGVSAISFRTDGSDAVMTADNSGNVFTWDLNEQKLQFALLACHAKGPLFAQFLPGEPLLLTCGVSDNALKLHLFDNVSGQPRVLRSRVGHHLPPNIVRFCGHDAFSMVSAGMDRGIRLLCAVNEAKNEEMSQRKQTGSKSKKRRRVALMEAAVESREERRLPPVTGLACSNMRERDDQFANIVTIHQDSETAYTWKSRNATIHKHVLVPPPARVVIGLQSKTNVAAIKAQMKKHGNQLNSNTRGRATSVALSFCGVHCLVGYENGEVHCFNMQSGRHIGAYEGEDERARRLRSGKMPKILTPERWRPAHKSSVAAISINACGDFFVSAGANDNCLKFWNLQSQQLHGDDITTDFGITHLQWSRTSDLIAVAADDLRVYIYDASTRKLARRFSGHAGPITDISFSPKGRQVLSSSTDRTVKIWDLPSGTLVESYECENAPSSLAIAPDVDYFATTHINELGITIWGNNSHGLETKDDDDDDDEMDVDDAEATEVEESPTRSTATKDNRGDESEGSEDGFAPLSDHLVTLSGKPSSQWTVLSNLSEIRARNKPVEQVQKPKAAPFFIPTKKGLQTEFDLDAKPEDQMSDDETGNIKASGDANHNANSLFDDDDDASMFGKFVMQGNFEQAAKLLRTAPPSRVDVEIRTVGGPKARHGAAEYFVEALSSPLNYELAHAHLAVFLKTQGLDLARDEGGKEVLEELIHAQEASWDRLRSNLNAVSCLAAHFSGQS